MRALSCLQAADAVWCEDTRVTHKLFKHYGINTPLYVYNDHATDKQRKHILRDLEANRIIALVSDAGTPLISDPGYKLVKEVQESGYKVHAIPGASALTGAASISGLPTDILVFLGFLPPKKGPRQSALKQHTAQQATLVCYERGSRLDAVLSDVCEVFGEHTPCALVKELTKQHEQVHRMQASHLKAHLAENPMLIKGEHALLIHHSPTMLDVQDIPESELKDALSNHPTKQAAAMIAERYQVKKNAVYERLLTLKG